MIEPGEKDSGSIFIGFSCDEYEEIERLRTCIEGIDDYEFDTVQDFIITILSESLDFKENDI